MATRYVVQPGDNLSRIARRHGLRNWRELYDAQDEDFIASHPDPDLIHPGDVLWIPGPAVEEEQLDPDHFSTVLTAATVG